MSCATMLPLGNSKSTKLSLKEILARRASKSPTGISIGTRSATTTYSTKPVSPARAMGTKTFVIILDEPPTPLALGKSSRERPCSQMRAIPRTAMACSKAVAVSRPMSGCPAAVSRTAKNLLSGCNSDSLDWLTSSHSAKISAAVTRSSTAQFTNDELE